MKYLIPGNPVPLMRPRGYGTRVYDPQKDIKEQVGMMLRYQHGTKELFVGALEIDIIFFMEIPASLSDKKKKVLDCQYHCKRPDIDNLIKFVLDTANGILFKDDCLVASVIAKKVYGSEPCTEFTIRTL